MAAPTPTLFGMYKQLASQIKVPLVPFMLEGVAEKPPTVPADRLHPLAERPPYHPQQHLAQPCPTDQDNNEIPGCPEL
jgi:hypothetical protein